MGEKTATPDKSSRALATVVGFAAGCAYILGVGIALDGNERVQLAFWAFFPLAQFIYIGPLAFFAWQKGKRRAMQGWLIGAAIATVLYFPCWGLAMAGGLGHG